MAESSFRTSPIKRNVKRKTSPIGSIPSHCCRGIQPHCLSGTPTLRVVFLRASVLFRLRVRSGNTLPLPCGSISLSWRRRSFS